jgi:7-carboxy-7-deazaguanine synthase
LVVLSGGNPALQELGALCERIHALGLRISVETQATKYRNWLRDVDRLCLSPKPPSSEMKFYPVNFLEYLSKVTEYNPVGSVFVKVVVFDHTDYEWGVELFQLIHSRGYEVPFYLSAGNDSGSTVGNPSRQDDRSLEQVRSDLLSRYLWLINRVIVDPRWEGKATVQAQAHVLSWGNKAGV